MRTYSPKPGDIQRDWHVIDATDVVLGRLAVQTANLLRGKHKTIFAPHVDTGDFVIIVNAEKVSLSGTKKTTKMARMAIRHPMRRHVKARFPHMNVTRIDEPVSTDPIFANCKSIYHIYVVAQVFYDTKSHTVGIYGVKAKK